MNRAQLGRAEIFPRDDVVTGSMGTWRLTYTVGSLGVDDGGAIRFAMRNLGDWERPQFGDPGRSGYTTVTTTGHALLYVSYHERGHVRPWKSAINVDVRDGSLEEGDRVTVALGDRSGGGPGIRMKTFRDSEHAFKVLVDCFGTGRFEEVEESPSLRITGGPAERIQVASPSDAVVGVPVTITVRALDLWGNVSDGYTGTVSFGSSDPRAQLPDEHRFTGEDRGAVRLGGVVLNTEGVQTISVRDSRGSEAVSNPVIVRRERPRLRLLWGDMHGQTRETVGTGTLDEYFHFLKDVASMDFGGWQGNDFQVSKMLWREVREKTRRFNEPGRFAAFLGYEWSGTTPAGGDHNIIYLGDDGDIHRSSHWLVDDRSDEETDRYPLPELWRTLRGRKDVMAIAHVGGRPANFDHHDPELVPLIEVHSNQGTFEWFLEEALTRELRVGFVANSDDHTCRPGLTSPSGVFFGTRGGYTAVYASELSREAVWEALRSRRCYATNGDRIILWVEVDGHPMGEEFEALKPPEIRVRLVGTAPLHEVEVKRGVETIYRHPFAEPGHGEEQLIKVEWSGVRARGRDKRVDWEGGLRLDRGRIASFSEFAFDHVGQGVRRVSERGLAWSSTTDGDPDGVLLRLDAPDDAEITFESKPVGFSVRLGEIGFEPFVVEAGGVNQRVKVSAISAGELPRSLEFSHVDDMPRRGLNPYWVRVVQSDGGMAWSSPVYVHAP